MSNYFGYLPDLLYLDRGNKEIRTYARTKNLFRRIRLREINDGQATNFEFYNVLSGERPDNVAQKFYDDPALDWVILLANNIIDIYSEWPLDNTSFQKYVEDKYGDTLYDVKHYESMEVRNSMGEIIFNRGVIVPQDFVFEYFDIGTNQNRRAFNMAYGVRNYDIEERRQNRLRAIRILKPAYLQLVKNEIEELLSYDKNSAQYQSRNLKMVEDIRITL